MKTNISYADLPSEDMKDAAALVDMESYLSPTQWDTLRTIAAECKDFEELNVCIAFCGVSGRPVHAFGRRYAPAAYARWMDGVVELGE